MVGVVLLLSDLSGRPAVSSAAVVTSFCLWTIRTPQIQVPFVIITFRVLENGKLHNLWGGGGGGGGGASQFVQGGSFTICNQMNY